MAKATVHISVGELNGVSTPLLLKGHASVLQFARPVYHCHAEMLLQAADLLKKKIPATMNFEPVGSPFDLTPTKISGNSGRYSFASLQSAFGASTKRSNEPIVTLPIHKKAWQIGNVPYVGHTDYFRHITGRSVLMMLGGKKRYVVLFTDHIPLKEVSAKLTIPRLLDFMLLFARVQKPNRVGVLGFNPHAGEQGLLGQEEQAIVAAMEQANGILNQQVYHGPYGADSYFVPEHEQWGQYSLAMYHDQGLIPIKALMFYDAIQISLNLPVLRTSPCHGAGLDKFYDYDQVQLSSYLNAVNFAAAGAL